MKIFIAGASGGIGAYLAKNLAEKHQVFGSYNSRAPSIDTKYQMTKVDIGSDQEVSAWIGEYAYEADDLALIYCVGINYNCMIHKSDSEQWQKLVEANLFGVQALLKEILPLMRQKNLAGSFFYHLLCLRRE